MPMKFTMPSWPILATLAVAVIVGIVVHHLGWLVVGWTEGTIGWLTAIRLGVTGNAGSTQGGDLST